MKKSHVPLISLVLQIPIPKSKVRGILEEIARLEGEGYLFENAQASLKLVLRRLLSRSELPFSVESYHVSIRGNSKIHQCEAALKVRIGPQVFHEVAEGNGPINALDCALRQALRRRFKKLDSVSLKDYSVRMLDSAPGTAAKTSVLIESSNGEKTWRTIGVSQNVIEASLQALVDSFEFALL